MGSGIVPDAARPHGCDDPNWAHVMSIATALPSVSEAEGSFVASMSTSYGTPLAAVTGQAVL